jgi:uncharacterized protein YbjQ (UPF0145 family)
LQLFSFFQASKNKSESFFVSDKKLTSSNKNQEKFMIITTTNTLEGHQIDQYLGIVSGETIIGANVFKDFFASITDIVGGRSSSYEQVLREAKSIAMSEMELQAKAFGANAIIGIDLDYETIREGMLMVTACGTAVKTTKL